MWSLTGRIVFGDYAEATTSTLDCEIDAAQKVTSSCWSILYKWTLHPYPFNLLNHSILYIGDIALSFFEFQVGCKLRKYTILCKKSKIIFWGINLLFKNYRRKISIENNYRTLRGRTDDMVAQIVKKVNHIG